MDAFVSGQDAEIRGESDCFGEVSEAAFKTQIRVQHLTVALSIIYIFYLCSHSTTGAIFRRRKYLSEALPRPPSSTGAIPHRNTEPGISVDRQCGARAGALQGCV